MIGRPILPERPPASSCLPIESSVCANLTYGLTSFPNMAVMSPSEAEIYVGNWTFFSGCHPQSQLLTCSYVYPECVSNGFGESSTLLRTCRSLCESVMDRCAYAFEHLNLTPMINCSHFPEPGEESQSNCITGSQDVPSKLLSFLAKHA